MPAARRPSAASAADLDASHTPRYLASLGWSINIARITEVAPAALLPACMTRSLVLTPMLHQTRGAAGVVAPRESRRCQHSLPRSPRWAGLGWAGLAGTVEAAHYAMQRGVGINLGGGFHHASRDHGHGFCVYNDLSQVS